VKALSTGTIFLGTKDHLSSGFPKRAQLLHTSSAEPSITILWGAPEISAPQISHCFSVISETFIGVGV
jgi:hypothetical protein